MQTRLGVHLIRATIPSIAALFAVPAFAHTGPHHMTGFIDGVMHPFMGLDHLLAMVAVGLIAAQSRRYALWILPIVFPLMLVTGALLGMAGVRFPAVESGIASSLLVLGLLIAFAVRMPLWGSAMIVSFFALLHGHAHGTEMPVGTSAVAYGAGFVIATFALHLAGLGLGSAARRSRTLRAMRLGGAGIAATGLYLLAVGWISAV